MKVDHCRQGCMRRAAQLNLHGYTCQNAAASSLLLHKVQALKRKSLFACLERIGSKAETRTETRSYGMEFVIASSMRAIRIPAKKTNRANIPSRGRDFGSANRYIEGSG
jgi:hypothetical protein